MTLYVDSSAFVKRYVATEPLHAECVQLMDSHDIWVTSRITDLETTRTLQVVAGSVAASGPLEEFGADLMRVALVEVDRMTIAASRDVTARTGIKSLDSIHLASALLLLDSSLRFLTYDRQQARAAAQLGLTLAR